MPSADEIRDGQRATWAGLSAGWEKWDSVIMEQLGPVGAAMIERLDIAFDHLHLDVAAGTGEPGLSIARLAPKGRVVLTDLVAEMLDVAARRARAQGVANIETKVCSADDLPFNDASFDSVSVRFGYMFFPDVAKATAEFARVLKPGGRLRFVTDWKDYAGWALERLTREPGFVWLAEAAADWRDAPDDHVTTRYQEKLLGDTQPIFLEFERRAGKL